MSFRILFNQGNLTILLLGFLLNTSLFSQLPTAQQVARHMKVGWNLGNTLEAICGENAWGNPATIQKLIDSVKAAGFDAVRLPCVRGCHTTNGVINATWFARVKEVVDYCINDSIYMIINIHWHGGWLENNVTTSAQAAVNAKQKNYWTQIAKYFKDYDEHLLFANANEPNVSDAAGMSVLLSYHQTFIDAVRATGGNNTMGILDRNTGAVVDKVLLDAVMQGAGKRNTTSIIDKPNLDIKNEFMLEQNYPNPFNPASVITYEVPKSTNVSIRVYDSLGRQVAVLINHEIKSAGIHKISFNASYFAERSIFLL